jgi:aspartyl-tRNA(Asn)/glutamyl-tRNA(Gln) amidotransferase subunit C
MKVTDEMIQNLAELSKLEFDSREQKQLRTDLQKMIGMIGKLNELDTEGIEPVLHMTAEVNALRNDEVKGSISRDEALKNAALKDDQFFKVPKVIRK